MSPAFYSTHPCALIIFENQVAAGMAARLDIEIFAVAVGVEGSSGVGSIGHHIEIITESDALYLPVVASILFAY